MPEIVPLTNDSSSLFNITLGENELNFQTKFNTRYNIWEVDIYDQVQTPLVYGVPLLLGSDVLAPYNLGLGSLVVVDLREEFLDANVDNIGSEVILSYFLPDELQESVDAQGALDV